ncbi:MAG: Lrp/AsnC family transcriptional regulator [Candidatus Thermoplasmatota archaeon]|nr:Lrp/AsnC family transcriptional regulator [Candidatus Thermoplasmatota archaeon]
MDEIDWKIIQNLRMNSRISNSELGRRLNLSEGAIRKRIKILQEKNIIKQFTIVSKNDGIEAIVFVRIDPKKSQYLKDYFIRRFEEIYEFSGRFDIAIHFHCKSIEELNEKVDGLREIEGIRNTDTLIRMS